MKLQQRLVPSVGSTLSYKINYPARLASPDDENHIVSSTKFTFNGRPCSIKNLLKSTTLQIIADNGQIEAENIGSYDEINGRIDLVGFAPTAIEGDAIKFSATPANQSTVRPLRNFILDIDKTKSQATGIIDNQNTLTTL